MLEHTSKEIIGKKSRSLLEHNIIIGVTASISLYKSLDLSRELMRRGAEVYVVLSKEASRLVTPAMWEWATGNKPFTEFSGELGHISLAKIGSGMIIAPATANTISKLAYGISDTPVTLVAQVMLGMGKKIIVVPAMHEPMYRSPTLRRAIEVCRENGVFFLDPVLEEGKAKYPDYRYIADKTEAVLLRGEDLRGLKILVTAGPTREPMDPVRFLSNPSTGKMGVSIASEAYYRGAETHLIHGPISIDIPPWIKTTKIMTVDDMLESVTKSIEKENPNAVILSAAPVDFRFSSVKRTKISSEDRVPDVKLEHTPKIASRVRKLARDAVIVGFAAETAESEDELIEKAIYKLHKYDFDLIMANFVGRPGTGFGYDTDDGVLINRNGKIIDRGLKLKREWARTILDETLKIIRKIM